MTFCNVTEKPEVAPKPTKRELFEKEKAFEFVVDVRGKPGVKLASTEELELEVSPGELSERLSETSEVALVTEVKDKDAGVSIKDTKLSEAQAEVEQLEVKAPESK